MGRCFKVNNGNLPHNFKDEEVIKYAILKFKNKMKILCGF
ncbi:hypothetical protein SAMN04488111_2250 [Lutibacter flavus]|uniref:Uncharacterized protein n=1 Tax=Lutibacter flavus TaxID=691689 RepID=A0A238Y190_9FLAO|nr:hypothetical protein SAMN04488111_2250 [Lutibacter flavus]